MRSRFYMVEPIDFIFDFTGGTNPSSLNMILNITKWRIFDVDSMQTVRMLEHQGKTSILNSSESILYIYSCGPK